MFRGDDMSSKSGIFAVNTTQSGSLAVGSIYNPTSVIRKYGKYCSLNGEGITIGNCSTGAGYYDVDATVCVLSSAAGTVTAQLYKDGSPVTGAVASVTVTAANQYVCLPISAMVRLNCNCDTSVLTIVMGGQTTTPFNLAVNVEKE